MAKHYLVVPLGLLLLTIGVQRASAAGQDRLGAWTATLNRLEIVLDGRTGSILSLAYPGPGEMLQTTRENASILDLAYPVPQFEPLRLASRFSEAKITRTPEQVTIRWDRLGASRDAFSAPGRVAATVTLKAAPDSKSIILTCRIENRSARAVRQVFFPDLLGLVPFGGKSQTEFRSGGPGGAVVRPFESLTKPERDQFYAVNSTFAEFTSDGKDSQAVGRWMLLGTDKAGLALFPRRWVWESPPIVMLQYCEKNDRLRMMCVHYVNLAEGADWDSGEYWLTPYTQGWAEAAAPYRAWVEQQGKRQ